MPRKAGEELTSIEHGCFDTAALQQELAAALEEDRLYKLTDSMKKRAIHTAANYDEFKNMVACADLKPVTQRELQDMTKTPRSTNLFYTTSTRAWRSKKTNGRERGDNLTREPSNEPPSTAVAFSRCWRRSLGSVEGKRKYLELTGPERLATLFRSELDADLMADIVHVLVASWGVTDDCTDRSPDDASARFALRIAQALVGTSRFSLLRDFFDNNQLDNVQELFKLIEQHVDALDNLERELLDELRAKFRLPK